MTNLENKYITPYRGALVTIFSACFLILPAMAGRGRWPQRSQVYQERVRNCEFEELL